METRHIERRLQALLTKPSPENADMARIVQQGLLIQACLGTIGAVEFLKARDVDGAIIHRVLTSQQVRAEDRDPARDAALAPQA